MKFTQDARDYAPKMGVAESGAIHIRLEAKAREYREL
jgi:hypothetical protein